MATVERSVVVDVPVSTAYNQWTQFEDFPRFMEGVEKVVQIDDTTLRWTAEIGGKREEWEARILHQEPDSRIAWMSTTGIPNGGDVEFQLVDEGRTKVTARVEYEPQGVVEKAGDALGVVERRVEGDLGRFKAYIEERGAETGAWRGEVRGGSTA